MDDLPPVTKSACNECPWRTKSLRGYIGPHSAEKWIAIAHSDAPIACHKTIKMDEELDGTKQCAGAARFRANVNKLPRNRSVAVGPEDETIFTSSEAFVNHHKPHDPKETW